MKSYPFTIRVPRRFSYLPYMKTLLVIRHAKSEQGWLITDFDRPLNDRGKRDAPAMAGRLEERKARPQLIVSSPAKRARKTAEYFFRTAQLPETDFVLKSELYHAHPQVFFEVVEQLDDRYDRVALFSHNPGITAFVNMLTASQIDNMPTCGIFAIQVNTGKWKDFRKAAKTFLFFEQPVKG